MIRLASLVVLCGCRLITRELDESGCPRNEACARGEVCVFGSCQPAGAQPVDGVFVEITPPGRQANLYLPQQQALVVDRGGRAPIAWATTVQFAGEVTSIGSSMGARLVDLRLSYRGNIPGRPQQFLVHAGNDAAVRVNLEPGNYDITIIPPNPAELWEIKVEDLTVSEDIDFFTLSYPTQTTTIRGKILADVNDPFAARSDVTVYAVNDESGLLSTIDQSDESGEFSVVLAGQPKTATLHIGPGRKNPFLPDVEVRNVLLQSGAAPPTSLVVNLPNPIYITDVGSTATISGYVHGAHGDVAVRNATVSAETGVGGGSYRTSTTTDATGLFSLAVIRGSTSASLTYTVRVVPPLSNPPTFASQFAPAEVKYVLPSTGEALPLEMSLPMRPALSGVVVDHTGRAVKNAVITARPAGDANRGDGFEALSADDGGFSMRLDIGDYRLFVVPQPGLLLARTEQALRIEPGDNKEIEVHLPRPALVAGELSAPPGRVSLRGASLFFYLPVDDMTPPRLIGQATVDANLHYSVVLPAAEQ